MNFQPAIIPPLLHVRLVACLSVDAQVNTERFSYLNIGNFHQEGGWPKDVDPTEKDQTQ